MTECSDPEPIDVDITGIKVYINNLDSHNLSSPDSDNEQIVINRNRFKLIVMAKTPEIDYHAFSNEVYFDRLVHPVTDVKIITINRFNETYPAGSIVNAAFGVTNPSLTYLGLPWPERGKADAFISKFYFPLYYIIRTSPDPGEHQFRIEYTLSNGNILTTETPLITLN